MNKTDRLLAVNYSKTDSSEAEAAASLPALTKFERRLAARLREAVATSRNVPPNSGKMRLQVKWLVRRETPSIPALILTGTIVRNIFSGDESITFQYVEVRKTG